MLRNYPQKLEEKKECDEQQIDEVEPGIQHMPSDVLHISLHACLDSTLIHSGNDLQETRS